MAENIINIHEQKLVSEIAVQIIFKGTLVVYKGEGLRLIISVCCSWEMAVNVGINVSFHNM
jgi:hypothetical protein